MLSERDSRPLLYQPQDNQFLCEKFGGEGVYYAGEEEGTG